MDEHYKLSVHAPSLELNLQNMLNVVHLILEATRFLKRAVGLQSALAALVFELYREIVANLIDKNDCLLIKPFDPLSILPESILYIAFCVVNVST